MEQTTSHWVGGSALGGGLIWAIVWLATLGEGVLDPIARLLLLAMLVLAPLTLALLVPTVPPGQERLFGWLVRAQPVAAALGVTAFLLPSGPVAAGLTGGWLLWAGGLAGLGLLRWRAHPRPTLAEACLLAAHFFLPVGAGWPFLARLGINPMGFSDAIVLLTAIHFHYAGFVAPVLIGRAGQWLADAPPSALGGSLFRWAALGIMTGPPLVAVGITLSRPIEVLAATWLASALLAFGLLTLLVIVPRLRDPLAKGLLALSGGIVLLTMLFAIRYALGYYLAPLAVTIPRMVTIHGWGNALFALSGLGGWWWLTREGLDPQS